LHRLILFIQYVRGIVVVRYSVRFLFILLLVVGAWVATHALQTPSTYEVSDKLIHLVVFFGFAVLVDFSSVHPSFWLRKGIPLLMYGACIEIMQYFTPERSFSLLDWWADFAGVLLYFMLKKGCVWLTKNRGLSV
jgi:VanZ family protein